jgi:hypothetical protein
MACLIQALQVFEAVHSVDWRRWTWCGQLCLLWDDCSKLAAAALKKLAAAALKMVLCNDFVASVMISVMMSMVGGARRRLCNDPCVQTNDVLVCAMLTCQAGPALMC